MLSEASASALKDVIAEEGISQEQRAESIAAAREERMQQLLYAITVLASSSGGVRYPHTCRCSRAAAAVSTVDWLPTCKFPCIGEPVGCTQHMLSQVWVCYADPDRVLLCCACCAGVATERAKFMDLVRQQVRQLQDTHGTESTSLTFTGGGLQAVRPEEMSDVVSGPLKRRSPCSLLLLLVVLVSCSRGLGFSCLMCLLVYADWAAAVVWREA